MGNLRTALAAWAWARSTGRRFLLRNEDIDPQRTGAAAQQRRDLELLGLDWDGPVWNQSERLGLYDEVLHNLQSDQQLFECYCSRKDIREAARAPHATPGQYPGTCRHLDPAARKLRREELAANGRQPALRLIPPAGPIAVQDYFHGQFLGPVDAFTLRRGDGVPAYNLACVVDDLASGVDQIVRGDDLLGSSPAQAYLAQRIAETGFLGALEPSSVRAGADGGPSPDGRIPPTSAVETEYVHVPLVLGPTHARLAKRDGAVTVEALAALGWSPAQLFAELAKSLGAPGAETPDEFLAAFTPSSVPREPQQFSPEDGFTPAATA